MKFHTAALQFLVASEALRFGVRAQSVVVDRTSNTNVADAAVSDVLLETPADSGGRFSGDGSSSKTGTTYHTVADAGVSDVLLETPVDSGGRFFPTGINNLRVVDSITRGDGSSSKTGTTYQTVANAGVSDVLLESPADSGSRFSPSDINNLRVDSVTRCDGSSSKTGTMYHTIVDAGASDVLVETLPADSDGGFSPSDINNLRVDSVTRGDGLSSKTATMHHTVADAAVLDVSLETFSVDSGGRFSQSDINNLRVDSVTRGDGLSSKTATMHHAVADAAVPDVSLETFSVDSGGRFSPSDINNLRVVVDGSSSKTSTMHHIETLPPAETLPVDSGGRFSSTGMDASAPNDVVNLYLHAVVDAINDNAEISSFTGTGGSDVSAQRKLIKSSKKVKHPEALCTLSLFADSLFLYSNLCRTDIRVTISPCDDKDDMCYISEHYPSLRQAGQENQEEEQCFVGGSFPAKQNIRYNPVTGDCEFLYVDLIDDPCESYTGDTGTGSLGLKARINMQNNPDVMFIQFTKDKGLTFYNKFYERVAKRSTNHNDRYLHQEGAMKPVLSMIPHPSASGDRQLFMYAQVSVKNDTPYEVKSIEVKYCACTSDENTFIASGGTWTAGQTGDRGLCLVNQIHTVLRLHDGTSRNCFSYWSSGTSIASFYIMWIDDVCCLRSWKQSNTECSLQLGTNYCDPSERNYQEATFCSKETLTRYSDGFNSPNGVFPSCATDMWRDGCNGCMCYEPGNPTWCDGLKGHYYDRYFEEHGMNPWGDTDVKNRNCNTDPIPAEGWTTYECIKNGSC